MKRRIRQGQTRWMLSQMHGPDGRVEMVHIVSCLAVRVHPKRVWFRSFDGVITGSTVKQWLSLHATRRAAWRAAWAMVQQTDRLRDAEYADAWSSAV